ncbi:hypothetical protein MA16_Dca009512 [Dendrobium catenatum]|uniref:Uncharacterized protein n=1 Tax=Dendrobium catenatum TaxID=906689 RepID=A0A2I0VRV0_9ASPA|nr:hypothetical protein MA16_Dca009512 [Dendrobium catenatum]
MQFQLFLPENTISVHIVKGVAKKSTTEVVDNQASKRAGIFSRLYMTPVAAPVIQKKVFDPKQQSVGVNTIGHNIIQDEVAEEYNDEVPDASVKLSRKARRKANARLRANGWVPKILQESSPQLEAKVAINNGFEPLKWVKRNDYKGHLKESFWETSRQHSQPPKKEESASS